MLLLKQKKERAKKRKREKQKVSVRAVVLSLFCLFCVTTKSRLTVVAYNSKVKLFFNIIIFNTCDEWTMHRYVFNVIYGSTTVKLQWEYMWSTMLTKKAS
jgi:hypothetical protein